MLIGDSKTPLDSVPGADPKMDVVSDEEMSISAFSRLTNLTPKALRVYERDELLVPARVDSQNGHPSHSPSGLAYKLSVPSGRRRRRR
jgi:hypothetical protein